MNDIDKIREWLKGFPRYDILEQFHVDYTDMAPFNGGIFPAGMVENSRTEDILGNVTVENQYNFGLYYVFEKASGDDIGSLENADWVMDFQRWVQEQSAAGLAPTFGDDPKREVMRAHNGALYGVESDGTTAMYMIQLSATFYKHFEVK